ncbi:MAG: IS701 family transposase [Candidatus Omnitrophica bacterium]|nr:IS701 family transposase [Candidatus Omnitrophota bacterium]
MSLFNVNVSIINRFCENFKENFSNTQFRAFAMLPYAMLKDYKRLNLSSLSKELPINYQALQYFLAEAKWNYASVNAARINLLRKQRTTGFSKDGVLAIDDTGSLKPYAKKTEGVSYQYCPSVKHEAYCNVAVVSCYANAAKHIPLNLRFYKPEAEFICRKNDPDFKSKLDFAKELIEETVITGIPFSHIVFDSWYASCDMIDFIDDLGKKFISEVKSDRRLFIEHPVLKNKAWLRADELVKLVKKYLWHKTRMINYNGKLVPVYTLNVKVKDTQVKLKAFCILGKWSEEDDKDCHILITNNLALDHKKACALYRLRWGIEQAFQELKDSFYFDHYQVRHKEKIMRYWMLSLLVWTLIFWVKQNAYLHKIISVKTSSCNEYKRSLLMLIEFSSYAALRKNDLLCTDHFASIKSQRFKNACYN